MGLKTEKGEASFYCNRCDKWVDGIEDKENAPHFAGYGQVFCDECGGVILYPLRSKWKRFRGQTAQFFARIFASPKK